MFVRRNSKGNKIRINQQSLNICKSTREAFKILQHPCKIGKVACWVHIFESYLHRRNLYYFLQLHGYKPGVNIANRNLRHTYNQYIAKRMNCKYMEDCYAAVEINILYLDST